MKQALEENPHSTLQIILQPRSKPDRLTADVIDHILSTAYARPNYLDRYYSLNPQGWLGSKRVLIKHGTEIYTSDEWVDWLEATPAPIVARLTES